VAALLVEAVGDQPLLLVIDELERVIESADAVAVLRALVRYPPDELRVVLLSRCELPLDIASLRLSRRAAIVDERELAFTLEEASQALGLLGADETDPKAVLDLTGGWVAGVMFEAWRAGDGCRPEHYDRAPDLLQDYLARNILEQLPADERELLLVTSVLSTVTAERAEALGIRGAAARLVSLRSRHLPATWDSDPLSMRCHTRVREYLRDELARSDPERWSRASRYLEPL
jgi:ATP/maltotriose-dependent transcriptional regulator MalT